MAERSNAQWLQELTAESEVRDAAIQDLRQRLQRGIYYYLSRERSDLSGLAAEEIVKMAEDFAQDATLRVLANLDSFRGDSQFTTWATKVAVRIAISEMRRARYKDFSLDTLMQNSNGAVNATSVINSDTPDRPEQATEKQDALLKIMNALTEV